MGGATSQLQTPALPADATVLSAGNVAVNVATYRVTVADEPAVLTFKEFELLKLLLNQRDRIIPYEVLADALWNSTGRRQVRRLGVVVCRLRAKLAASSPYNIETVRGRGYGLVTSTGR